MATLYEFAGSDEGIARINQDSRTMCELEEAFWSAVIMKDWATALQMAHGFVQVWTRPLNVEDFS
jgi:hypothetical protein